MFWTNWREIEKHNDWGVRGKDDDTASLWNDTAADWEQRAQNELSFNQRQVDTLNIHPDDVVLDVCCGTGPLTIPLAMKVKKVYALDFSGNMLDIVKEKAERSGLSNIEFIQGNWNTMEPGVDYPIVDIAVTRHSPAQGNILKFSRCAKKYCYSLSYIYDPSPKFSHRKPGRWLKSANETANYDERPDGRFYGQNIHFNLLYEAGAHPEVRYVRETTVYSAGSKEELVQKVYPKSDVNEQLPFIEVNTHRDGNLYIYQHEQSICVMGWNPSEIRFDLLEMYGII